MSEPRVILITGASRGIGLNLAEHYSRRGDRVIGCSRKPPASDLAGCTHVCLDVAEESAVKDLMRKIRSDFGRLDVLVNNAGIASMNHLLLTPLSTAEKIMRTNFLGTFLFTREAGKIMQKNDRGRIVNLTTVAVPLKLAGESVYAASKAAIASFTEISARELAPYGITVNAIGPTPIKTDLTGGVPAEKLEQLIKLQAIQRYGTFADVRNVVDFFISPDSDFITGQTIYLGGV